MGKAIFVTGTDTNVGKTYIACGILAAARKIGLTTAAIKPVAAGVVKTDAGLYNDDALALHKQCTLPLSYEQINPVLFEQAIAPHIAAEQLGQLVSVAQLLRNCREVLALNADFTVIEGAGGWKVPLNRKELFSDLVKELKLPVVIVVAMRLGCINHALLTEQAILADGLEVKGWIANQVLPDMQVYEENLNSLQQRLCSPLLNEIKFEQNFSETASCAEQLTKSRLFN